MGRIITDNPKMNSATKAANKIFITPPLSLNHSPDTKFKISRATGIFLGSCPFLISSLFSSIFLPISFENGHIKKYELEVNCFDIHSFLVNLPVSSY